MIKPKTLITTISLLLTSLCLLFFMTAAESKEKQDITIRTTSLPAFMATFETCYLADSTFLTITLSDASRWIIKNEPADTYTTISQKWKIGDDIRLEENREEASKKDSGFILKNVRNNAVYLVELDSSCANTSRAFYISKIDQNGYAIMTNDGSEWAIGWLGSFNTQKWQVNDRIIINKSYHLNSEDYCLINARDSSSCWASLVSWK